MDHLSIMRMFMTMTIEVIMRVRMSNVTILTRRKVYIQLMQIIRYWVRITNMPACCHIFYNLEKIIVLALELQKLLSHIYIYNIPIILCIYVLYECITNRYLMITFRIPHFFFSLKTLPLEWFHKTFQFSKLTLWKLTQFNYAIKICPKIT